MTAVGDSNSSVTANHPPLQYHFGFTTRYNLKCRMCPTHSEGTKLRAKDVVITEPVLEASMDGLKEYAHSVTHIGLTDYGEPFLYKDIFIAIERIHSLCPNAIIHVVTNGTLLSVPTIEKILDSSLTSLGISLDSAKRHTYEKIRIGANFSDVLNNIRTLVKLRTSRNKKTPHIMTGFVLMKSNITELPDYVKLCIDLGVDSITAVNPHGVFESDADQVLYHLPGVRPNRDLTKFEKIIDKARNIAARSGIPFYCPNLTPAKPATNCTENGRTRPFIIASGDVYPCCILAAAGYLEHTTIEPMGNLRCNSLKEIWESPAYVRFRRAFLTGEPPCQTCVSCPRYYGI